MYSTCIDSDVCHCKTGPITSNYVPVEINSSRNLASYLIMVLIGAFIITGHCTQTVPHTHVHTVNSHKPINTRPLSSKFSFPFLFLFLFIIICYFNFSTQSNLQPTNQPTKPPNPSPPNFIYINNGLLLWKLRCLHLFCRLLVLFWMLQEVKKLKERKKMCQLQSKLVYTIQMVCFFVFVFSINVQISVKSNQIRYLEVYCPQVERAHSNMIFFFFFFFRMHTVIYLYFLLVDSLNLFFKFTITL